jgi:hypothetical protein
MTTLLTNPSQRAAVLGTIAALILRAQRIEQNLSQARADVPTPAQAAALDHADLALGMATRALQIVAADIEKL